MIHIAICDDEKNICTQVETMLERISISFLRKTNINIFNSGESLKESLLKGEYFDIIFLDIEMNLINGVEIGKVIREEMNNETTQIVYISSKESYAMELFQVRPLDFLLKPLNYEKIEKVFKTAINLIKRQEEVFNYQIGHMFYKIPIKEIIHFESNNRKINMVTINGTKSFYGNLSEVFSQLEGYKYMAIHKSYLVNYSHVAIFEYSQVTMSNGDILPISQGRRKEIRSLQLGWERDAIRDDN